MSGSDFVLETRDLTKEFKGFVAVGNVNLKVRRGSIHAMIGPNGAGKTTCFNLLTKFLRPTSGQILFEGRDITTVVCPDAAVRVLLVADPVRRMARRGAELAGAVDEAALRDQVLRRDKDDSTLVNFTDAAPGVTVIDSTELTVDEVVDRIITLARDVGLS